MLQNVIVTAFIVSELLRDNQQRESKLPKTHPPRIGLRFEREKWRFSSVECHTFE